MNCEVCLIRMQVVSDENQNLTVTSEKAISVQGHEGVFFDGKMLQFIAKKNVDISSSQAVTNFVTWCIYLNIAVTVKV